jgi:hypothetical protein
MTAAIPSYVLLAQCRSVHIQQIDCGLPASRFVWKR